MYNMDGATQPITCDLMADQTSEVERSIQQKLSSLPKSPDNLSIYKVPEHIYKMNSECYMPSIVSVGPIYYNNSSLKSSQELKLRHLQCFLEYSTNINQAYSLSQCIDMIRECEEVVRSYYEETISLSSNEFIEMMMVDAAFIIYYLMRYSAGEFLLSEDPMWKRVSWIVKVEQDLFLQENQLPFFVLNDVYDMAFGAVYFQISFKDLVFRAIGNIGIIGREAARTVLGREKVMQTSDIKHLVDFLRVLCLPFKLRNHTLPRNDEEYQPPPTVKELKAAGVKFIATDSNSLLDIRFSQGVLQIPTLTIQDNTEAVLRNILIFEQCQYYNNSYFIDYLFFLDALIDTSEDVQILAQHGIIKHSFGSVEVADLMNEITECIMLYVPNFYYRSISQDLNQYAMIRWNKWKAVLRKDYFNHPWSITSVIYLVVLLILTVLQVYTGFMK